jgi:acid phosphatase
MTHTRKIVLFILCLLPGLGVGQQTATDNDRLPNLGELKRQIRLYHDCVRTNFCYASDLQSKAALAVEQLKTRLARKTANEKLAVVLDIDETALSNYSFYLATDFGFEASRFDLWVQMSNASPIEPTLQFYKVARESGVAVFFITGRRSDQRYATEQNLAKAGYQGWTDLFMRGADELSIKAVDFKSAKRKIIANRGYKIILNIGDQVSDLSGEPQAEVSVKLPNPMYLVD